MQMAFLYRRGNRVHFCSMSRSTAGGWIGTPTYLVCASDDLKKLCESTCECLSASTVGVRQPLRDEWESIGAELYATAGLDNWADFSRGARAVSVVRSDEGMLITPHQPSKNGFAPIKQNRLIVPSDTSKAAFADALNKAFSESKARP